MSRKTWRWIAVTIFIASVLMAFRLIGPAVPDEIRMLTGPEGTTFFEDGLRYKEILGRHGVAVDLVSTSGSIENLKAVVGAEDPTAALVWGIPDSEGQGKETPEGVESLGAMYLQPVWIFTPKGDDIERLKDLAGLKILTGEKGSDSRLLAYFILQEEGIGDEVTFAQDQSMSPSELHQAVQNDQATAIIAVGEPDSPLIDSLLRSPQLQVMSVRRAEAFAIQFAGLQEVHFPEGGHNLAANIPDHDLRLLAARAQLIVSDPYPPPLADLLLQAASKIHGGATPFSARGEFLDPETAPFELSRAAENFFTNGPPKLQRYLPFRLATWINRFLTAALALGSVAVTLFKIIPALISLPFKRNLRRGYGELQTIERAAAAGTDKKTLLAELAEVDQTTANIKVPMRKLEVQWLELRQYLHDMRDRLQ